MVILRPWNGGTNVLSVPERTVSVPRGSLAKRSGIQTMIRATARNLAASDQPIIPACTKRHPRDFNHAGDRLVSGERGDARQKDAPVLLLAGRILRPKNSPESRES